MLELRGISKSYSVGDLHQKVLRGINLNFRESEFAAILGPSGSGKTTLLNIIGGLDHYDAGDLKINEVSTKDFRDKDWDAYRNHRIGFVFQSYNLIPHQTILNNVKLALTLSGIPKSEGTRRAKRALEEVGLKEHIYKRPSQLSGGQMQRVAIARALVNDPDILLADEPTGALDSDTSVQIMNLLKKISQKKLVIMVTHNPELANYYATRIINLRDGNIVSDTSVYDGKQKTDLDTEAVARKQRKTRMSFLTALSLSTQNLLTKKARTVLVSIAGSIGIIGIALILSVSTGFQAYIDGIERDTLTSYPLALMKESTNIAEILLSVTGGGSKNEHDDNKIHENQVISSTLGTVTKNDLASFREYLNAHYDEVGSGIRLIENEYNIDPMIYTVDTTGDLARLNPNNLFSTILGSNSLMSSYSNLTSAFTQYDLNNIKADTHVVAGRYPENYNELVVYLSNPNQISDFLTYSLGFHDTDKLSDSIAKIMGGENVALNEEPLTLEYEDLLNVDLRLVLPANTYKYNEKYGVYEDMAEDDSFMQNVYDQKSERLKVVGIVTPNSNMLGMGSGVFYLPSLVEHIITESSKTDIVKKQLENPAVDIFSGNKFGEKDNKFDFEFSDLVSVDQSKISSAFNTTLDQNAVTAKTQEYMNNISSDITANITPVKEPLVARFKEMANKLMTEIAGLDKLGTYQVSGIDDLVQEYLAKQDFSEFESKYLVPSSVYHEMYAGLLKGYLTTYATTYAKTYESFYGQELDLETADIPADNLLVNTENVLTFYLSIAEVDGTFDTLAVNVTEIIMKKDILTEVGGLTKYLSSSFANAFSLDQNALLSAFKLNFSEEELARVVSAMFTQKESTLSTNLALLGYQALDDPQEIAFYFNSFEGKTEFIKFLDNYNEMRRSYDQDDKVIEYSDATGILMSSVKTIVDAVSYVLIAFVSISLIVSSIMIGVITYISVYERTKEIGILRAIGASKRNISNIFNAETFIIGLLSGLFGIGFSYLVIPLINTVLHHFTGDIPLSAKLNPDAALILIGLSIVLTLVGGLIPAKAASKKDPVEALRSE